MKLQTCLPALLLTLGSLASAAGAQTVTVTTSQNVIDVDFFTATVADLPGPDGEVSFLEATIATNHTPGHQTIAFNIPQSDWGLQFLYPGVAVIMSGPNGFNFSDSVTIDGTTQTAFTGDTNPVGAEVAIYKGFGSFGSSISGDSSVLTGFHAGEWGVGGSGCQVYGNTGGMHLNVGGSGHVISGNEAGTIKLSGASDVSVVANTMMRARIWGSSNIQLGGPTLAERNFITGYGTTNSEGLPSGTDVELFSTTDVVIENNYIGTEVDGMSQGNQYQTIGIYVDNGNTGLRVRDNLIAGVLGHGQLAWAGTLWGRHVYVQGSGSDVEFSGNTIGLDASGAVTLPSVRGIEISSSSTYTDMRFLDNVVAGHLFSGFEVGKGASGVRLQGNAVYENATSGFGFIGIDLIGLDQAWGVTPNDPLDADLGGNGLQNYPVLASAVIEGAGTRITGTLDSSPGADFTLELFASPACDVTGFGQGELVLGTLSTTTDGAGHADFTGLVAAAPTGWVVTSTATLEPIGSTSEFSACIATTTATCAADLGFGGPGASRLSLCGDPLASGQAATLRLDDAAPAAPAWVVFGGTFAPTPLFGGDVVPLPGQLYFLGSTDASGTLGFGPIPGGGGPVTLFAQVAHIDVAQPALVGLSNAVQVDLLP